MAVLFLAAPLHTVHSHGILATAAHSRAKMRIIGRGDSRPVKTSTVQTGQVFSSYLLPAVTGHRPPAVSQSALDTDVTRSTGDMHCIVRWSGWHRHSPWSETFFRSTTGTMDCRLYSRNVMCTHQFLPVFWVGGGGNLVRRMRANIRQSALPSSIPVATARILVT